MYFLYTHTTLSSAHRNPDDTGAPLSRLRRSGHCWQSALTAAKKAFQVKLLACILPSRLCQLDRIDQAQWSLPSPIRSQFCLCQLPQRDIPIHALKRILPYRHFTPICSPFLRTAEIHFRSSRFESSFPVNISRLFERHSSMPRRRRFISS